MASDRTGECSLCGRWVALTFHHLIPRKVHRRPRFKNAFSKAELNRGVWVCRLCHDGIHDRYDEMTLAQHFSTLEKLKTDPHIQRHTDWVTKQKVRA